MAVYQFIRVEPLEEEEPDEAPYHQSVFVRLEPAAETSVQSVTKLDVFNVAALALGFYEGVDDPDENSTLASAMSRRWDSARKSFLEEHTYNGAKVTVALDKKSTTPVGDWTSMFTLPEYCLRVITINGIRQSDGTDSWEVELDAVSGEQVVMTNASTVKASMIADVFDLSHLKTKVVEAMGLYLAYQVSAVFPMSGDRLGMLKEKLDHAVAITKGTDGQEGTPPQRSAGFLVQERKRRH